MFSRVVPHGCRHPFFSTQLQCKFFLGARLGEARRFQAVDAGNGESTFGHGCHFPAYERPAI